MTDFFLSCNRIVKVGKIPPAGPLRQNASYISSWDIRREVEPLTE